MPLFGKCTNYANCSLAMRDDVITLPDGAAFVCPECGRALVDTNARPGKKPMAVQYFILGGIISLSIMAAGAVYWQVQHLKKEQPGGQIGTSFEQAQVAGEHHDFLPSRHMPSTPTPSPAP
jgi:hypothetical protein